MPTKPLTNASVKVIINSSPTVEHDLSDHVKSVRFGRSPDMKENTAMGATDHTFSFGLNNSKIEVEFYQDRDTGKTDDVLSPLVGADTNYSVEVIPEADDPVSATNKRHTLTKAMLSGEYLDIDGNIGEMEMNKVVFVPAFGGAMVKSST